MSKTKNILTPSAEPRRTMAPVGQSIEKLTRPIFGRRGFVSGALIMDWPVIVGSALATYTLPQRIQFPTGERSGGTLHMKVASSAFAPEITHLEPLILERINRYFGWKAVDRLKLHHGPLPRRCGPTAAPPSPSEALPDSARHSLDRVTDPELRAVLERLGRHIAATGKGGD